jgi:hypothetical protein
VQCSGCQATFTPPAAERPTPPPPPAPPPRRDWGDERDDEEDLPRRPLPTTYRRREYEDDEDDEDDYRWQRRKLPHRGGSILTLGILSLTLFWIPLLGLGFGIGAITMAHTDLAEMRRGRMDRRGRDSTVAGRVCAIIGTVLSGALWLLCCGLRVAAIGQRHHF